MGGCLGLAMRVAFLGVLFLVGAGLGLAWWCGFFDPWIVAGSMEQVKGKDPAHLEGQVAAGATLEKACSDPASVDGRIVRWMGVLDEFHQIDRSLGAVRVRGEDGMAFEAFYDKSLDEVRAGDAVEVLGLARHVWVASEDRSGHALPQVLAVRIRLAHPLDRAGKAGSTGAAPAGVASPATPTSRGPLPQSPGQAAPAAEGSPSGASPSGGAAAREDATPAAGQ